MIKTRIIAAKNFVLDHPVASGVVIGVALVAAAHAFDQSRIDNDFTREDAEALMFDNNDPETIALVDRMMENQK